ncbi:MAG TPA: hypothetical protein VFD19_03225, partial [Clostridia bacterium]|nr:hypothetical protein [Clostridia bacterium]
MVVRFRSIPVSLRRRTLIVASVAILTILVVALSVVWQATDLRSGLNATVISLNERPAGQMNVAGTGGNLIGMPTTNLVTHGSFGPEVVHAHYFASSGKTDEFSFKVADTQLHVPLEENYYAGAFFTLFRESLSEMTLLGSGQITGYDAGHVSMKRAVDLPSMLPEGVRWNAFTEYSDATYVCGSSGSLLRLPKDGNVDLIAFSFPADLTAIASGPNGFIAGDTSGRLFTSPDGLSWSLTVSSSSGASIRAIEYIALPDYENGFFLASGGPGELYFGHTSGVEPLQFPMEDTVTALVQTGDGMVFALGGSGNVAASSNGIQWQVDETLVRDRGWLAGDAAGGLTCFVGEGGQMAIRKDRGEVRHLDADSIFSKLGRWYQGTDTLKGWPALTDIMVMSSSKLVVVTSGGSLIYSNDRGEAWSRQTPFGENRVHRLKRMPSGDIFLSHRDGTLTRAELTARLLFGPALDGEQVIAGDLISINLPVKYSLDTSLLKSPHREEPLQEGEWAISDGASMTTAQDMWLGKAGYDSGGACAFSYDPKTAKSLDQEEAEPTEPIRKDRLFSVRRGTAASMAVNNPNRPYLNARITQKLDLSRLIQKDNLPFYRLEFDARVEGAVEGPLEIWFAGSLPQVDESVNIQGDAWQHRRISLLFPRGLKQGDELWLNIGFAGSGTLYLDNIWFGRSDDALGALSSMLTKEKTTFYPDVIRLDAVPIGRAGHTEEQWCLPEGIGYAGGQETGVHNLGATLQLTERMGAVPWLVIDLHTTPAELSHLVEYLAGSPLSTYGKLRSRDGAIGRWTDAFDLLYIEIADLGNVLPNDVSRANYVHWIMDHLQETPDFADIRHKVFFIDAMRYDDGRCHTSADYHAGDFLVHEPVTDTDMLETIVNEWINEIPRSRIGGSTFMPELIRSISFANFKSQVRMVDATAATLADLGNNSALALVDIDLSDKSYISQQHVATRSLYAVHGLSGKMLLEKPMIIRGVGKHEKETTSPLPVSENDKTVDFFAFSSRDGKVLFALNLGQSSQLVSVQGFDQKIE